MALLEQAHLTHRPSVHIRPFNVCGPASPNSKKNTELEDSGREHIIAGIRSFSEAVRDGVATRTAEGYGAIITSATSFRYAREAFLKLAARNPTGSQVRESALSAAGAAERLEEIAVKVERKKRPGNSAQQQTEREIRMQLTDPGK